MHQPDKQEACLQTAATRVVSSEAHIDFMAVESLIAPVWVDSHRGTALRSSAG